MNNERIEEARVRSRSEYREGVDGAIDSESADALDVSNVSSSQALGTMPRLPKLDFSGVQ